MEAVMSFWGVAMCKANSEAIAEHHLGRQGYKTYLPRFIQKIGKETKIKVLFPRYIFVSIELQWHVIRSTRGVTKLIMRESTPAPVPNVIIDNLKKREDKGFVMLEDPPKFSQGEKVRVVNSALFGYIGIYQGMKDSERARVLIELLGQTVPVELDEKDLVCAVASNEVKAG
jgi:transcriptional antiterminator RfaH